VLDQLKRAGMLKGLQIRGVKNINHVRLLSRFKRLDSPSWMLN
jgi:hypothetical protein